MKVPIQIFIRYRLVYAFVIGPILLFSCQSDSNKQEIEEIAQSIRDNSCRIEAISEYVNDSWTTSIEELGKKLPRSLPQQERENILNLKNANLIRMFESYKTFDDDIHSLVDSMEQVDARWADSLRRLSQENQYLEMRLDSLFSTIVDREDEQILLRKLEEVKSSPCEDESIEM